jgi:hypothetical protein
MSAITSEIGTFRTSRHVRKVPHFRTHATTAIASFFNHLTRGRMI